MYTEEIVGIAKRENNTKRTYLVVNKLQGKHVPVKPKEALAMFRALAEQVKQEYGKERLLLIGFAETATAIGAAVAAELDCHYMQTTREPVADVEFIYFTESHSHATEQKLVKEDVQTILPQIDRIVFIEDEVTTGNTIAKIVQIIQTNYAPEMKFGVASILNGMNKEDYNRYQTQGITPLYLVKTNHSAYAQIAERYEGDGKYYTLAPKEDIAVTMLHAEGYLNARRLHKSEESKAAVEHLWQQVSESCPLQQQERLLVLGSEEFMYPALYVAAKAEGQGAEVRFHATTRSPIAVSSEADYPLHARYQLESLYDKERVTYIYELARYDKVWIITDAAEPEQQGLDSLVRAVREVGNTEITVIGWC